MRITVTVNNSAGSKRYEAELEGRPAGFVTYRERGDTLSILHTEVDPEFEGEGVGSALVGQALRDARDRNLNILPFCPFANSYIRSHPEFLALVPVARRSEFGLPAE